MLVLNENLFTSIAQIVEKGNICEESNKVEALAYYKKAWELFPEPKVKYELAEWVASCQSKLYHSLNETEDAIKWAKVSLESSSEIDTSSLISLGIVYFDVDKDKAFYFFKEAYKKGKYRAFQGYNKKYWHFFKSQ